MKSKFFLHAFFLFNCLSLCAQQSIQQLNWISTGATMEKVKYKDRDALRVAAGMVYLNTSTLKNGTIEVDVAPAGVMSGICFRIDDKLLNYENIYIRHPKSGLGDATQYTPVFNGEFNWQAYYEYQATARFSTTDWIHLRVVVNDGKAGLFLGSDSTTLYVDSLRTDNREGKVGLWSLSGSYFSNFTYSEKVQPLLYKNPPHRYSNPKAIKSWWVSEPQKFEEWKINAPDWKEISKMKFIKASTEPDGLLNIGRYARKIIFGKTRNNSHDVVWIKHAWTDSGDLQRILKFEYISRCTIFLNGKPIYSGNNSFLAKGSFYRGDIDKELKCNSLFLNTSKGENTLMIAVSSITNGWAFMGQID